LPLAKSTLGPAAVPAAAMVIVFNAITLWTLVTISIEWSRHGSFTLRGIGKMAWGVITSPLVAGIVCGTLFGLSGLTFPAWVDTGLDAMSAVAGPAALLILGMGLVQYGIRTGWQHCVAISSIKLILMPLTVWLLASLLGLSTIVTATIVLMASLSTGANVYLMALQFKSMQSAIAGSMVLSTAAAAITTPLILAVLAKVLG
jgi:malonate transporter and related proteins